MCPSTSWQSPLRCLTGPSEPTGPQMNSILAVSRQISCNLTCLFTCSFSQRTVAKHTHVSQGRKFHVTLAPSLLFPQTHPIFKASLFYLLHVCHVCSLTVSQLPLLLPFLSSTLGAVAEYHHHHVPKHLPLSQLVYEASVPRRSQLLCPTLCLSSPQHPTLPVIPDFQFLQHDTCSPASGLLPMLLLQPVTVFLPTPTPFYVKS